MKQTLYEYLFDTLEMSNKDAIDCIDYIQKTFPDINRYSIFSDIEREEKRKIKGLIAKFELEKLSG